jgi:hypothetical protein
VERWLRQPTIPVQLWRSEWDMVIGDEVELGSGQLEWPPVVPCVFGD